jgi:hypothetical protein
MVGCSQPPSAASNLRLNEAEQYQALELSPRQRAEVRSILTGLAGNHAPTGRPSPAQGIRWSDVKSAVEGAVMDVEMAIVRAEREFEPGAGPSHHRTKAVRRWTFHLWTVDDQPGELIVEHTGGGADGRVYAVSARIGHGIGGRYDEQRAERLLKAFDDWMNALAKKHSLQ